MSNQFRGSDGKYSKRGGLKAFFLIVVIVMAIVVLYQPARKFFGQVNYVNHLDVNATSTPMSPEASAAVKASDIENRMKDVKNRDDFKMKVAKFEDTEARRIATAEYEAAETAKYEAIKADIEKSKEQVRKDEVSF